jgi:hypothetical protein
MKVPTAQGGGHQAEASLAWARASAFVKRRQRARGPRERAPKDSQWRWPTRSSTGKASSTCQNAGHCPGPRHADPPGSETVARMQGLPRSLGDLVAPRRSRERLGKRPASPSGAPRSRSAEVRALTRGNRPDGTTPSKVRRRNSEPDRGNDGRDTALTNPLDETRTDSNGGETRGAPLSTLAHHINVQWLREAHCRTRKDGARGVDGQNAEQYAKRLAENLPSLLDRAKSGHTEHRRYGGSTSRRAQHDEPAMREPGQCEAASGESVRIGSGRPRHHRNSLGMSA